VGGRAAIAGMSEKHFIALFKEVAGITHSRYSYQLKMNRAREYIYGKRLSCKEIAAMLGYPDQYSFSKAFGKHSNVPPSRFT
jgi:AraC-like DNA-binding protein